MSAKDISISEITKRAQAFLSARDSEVVLDVCSPVDVGEDSSVPYWLMGGYDLHKKRHLFVVRVDAYNIEEQIEVFDVKKIT
jgi:hypothetical protein